MKFVQIILTLLFLLAQAISYSQSRYLVLKNRFKDKVKEIPENKRIKIIYDGDKKSSGELKIISNSSILVGNDTVNLFQIEVIKYKPNLGKIIGGALVTIGVVSIFNAIVFDSTINGEEITNLSTGVVAIGSSIPLGFGIGIMNNTVKFRKNLWEYSIQMK